MERKILNPKTIEYNSSTATEKTRSIFQNMADLVFVSDAIHHKQYPWIWEAKAQDYLLEKILINAVIGL